MDFRCSIRERALSRAASFLLLFKIDCLVPGQDRFRSPSLRRKYYCWHTANEDRRDSIGHNWSCHARCLRRRHLYNSRGRCDIYGRSVYMRYFCGIHKSLLCQHVGQRLFRPLGEWGISRHWHVAGWRLGLQWLCNHRIEFGDRACSYGAQFHGDEIYWAKPW